MILMLVSLLMGAYIAITGFTWRWTRWWIIPGLAGYAMSIVFSMLHWPGANILGISSLIVLLIVYSISISRKPRFTLLDYGKIAWALLVALRFAVQAARLPWLTELTFALVLGTVALTFLFMITPVNTDREDDPQEPSDILDWDQTKSDS